MIQQIAADIIQHIDVYAEVYAFCAVTFPSAAYVIIRLTSAEMWGE